MLAEGKRPFNNIFCYFNEEGKTCKEELVSSFIDYLTSKEAKKIPLAKGSKES